MVLAACLSLGAGTLGLAALWAHRTLTGTTLGYPQSISWLVACAALAVGCALLYWRATTRTPQ